MDCQYRVVIYPNIYIYLFMGISTVPRCSGGTLCAVCYGECMVDTAMHATGRAAR